MDTFRGTRDGVPRLLHTLTKRGIRATWYVTLGPDNMGRHAWRLLKPAFAIKMLRSGAPSLYGWEILLRGTLWPGPVISDHLADTLRMPEKAGHEVGVHAWDHHRWQMGADRLSLAAMQDELYKAIEAFERVYRRPPETAAAPGWRLDERLLSLPASHAFRYRSDARGIASPFFPMVKGTALTQLQVPVDLPTYDEGVRRERDADAKWNASLLARMADNKPHVLTIHAECEGGVKATLFEQFLDSAIAAGHTFEPLCDWLKQFSSYPTGHVKRGAIAGREGWVCVGAAP